MKTPSEVPGLSCSQGKPITTISPARLPVNNMTHKLIMLLSLLPPFCSPLPLTLSHSITPMTATPPVRCPAHFPSAALSFQPRSHLSDSGVGQMCQVFFEVGVGGGVGFGRRTLGRSVRKLALTSAQSLQVGSYNFRLFGAGC